MQQRSIRDARSLRSSKHRVQKHKVAAQHEQAGLHMRIPTVQSGPATLYGSPSTRLAQLTCSSAASWIGAIWQGAKRTRQGAA
jgi:hypothetical protein